MTETAQLDKVDREGLHDVSRNADNQKFATQSAEYDAGNGQQQQQQQNLQSLEKLKMVGVSNENSRLLTENDTA